MDPLLVALISRLVGVAGDCADIIEGVTVGDGLADGADLADTWNRILLCYNQS